MATGSGKTTVMAMLAAWSILNKVNNRGDSRFSDVVLVVCPNVTIRSRLGELDPREGDASLYRTRDLVPAHLMADLTQGRVLITNWHVFEPQAVTPGGVSAKVARAGVAVRTLETITIGPRTTTARNRRYLTPEELDRQLAAGLLTVLEEDRDRQGNLRKVRVESVRYVESDTALVNRVIGREVGGKQNVLVFNDEAHHAYRIRRDESDGEIEDLFGDAEDQDEFYREATVWVDGLDRIHKLRGINFCVDLSATPYYLGRMGPDTNRIFPWVVSDFGLTDAIESGLVKIPQLAVRDTTGADIPGYFNIWRWIMPRLTTGERGGSRGNPKPEAVVKWAATPVAMLAGLWEELRAEWAERQDDPRPPVFIIVCRNTAIAKVVYEWLALDRPPAGIPPANIAGFRNAPGRENTIRVDSKVVHETDSDQAKSDESAWMRLHARHRGQGCLAGDRQGRPIYPTGSRSWPGSSSKPLHPPGRDVRCIVSVGMLTEGWDCSTVTHIVGLRPFMSQLLCEQVVGRGLGDRATRSARTAGWAKRSPRSSACRSRSSRSRRTSARPGRPHPKRYHVHAVPARAALEIRFPRVEGYRQAIRNRVTLNWTAVPSVTLDPMKIPPEVEVKAALPNNKGRPSLTGPGKLERVDLNPYRAGYRMQQARVRHGGRPHARLRGPAGLRGARPRPVPAARANRRSGSSREQVHPLAAGEQARRRAVALLRLGDRGAGRRHQARHFGGRGARAAALREQAGRGLDRGGGLLDQPRRARGGEEPPQLRGGGHGEVGAVGRLHPRHPSAGRGLRQERGTRLRHALPAQRPNSRLRPGLHRPPSDRPAETSRAGNQGLRPARRGQGSRG